MKTNFYAAIIALVVFAGAMKANAQANKTLSNLTSPTSVNADLLPSGNGTKNLGSSGKAWNNVFANGAYFLDGSPFISNAGSFNTYLGSDAGHSTTTGIDNSGTGFQALYSNTSGSYNVANGVNALFFNTTGYSNTANGQGALYHNIDGFYNTANGTNALFSNTGAIFNTATGNDALYHNTGGLYNSAHGAESLVSNTDGNYNTASGAYSLYWNTDGSLNTANGEGALYNNTFGSYNVADGAGAMATNTTGNDNTAIGFNSLYENYTGSENLGVGLDAMFWNTTGNYNTGVGNYCLNLTTASGFNTAIGYYAGGGFDNGWNNVFLGANTTVNGTGYYNVVAIGQATLCTASSQARIGNSFTTSIGGYANWSNISDVRVKKNIKQNVPGLAFINKLQPITYNLDLDAIDRITQPQPAKDKDGKAIPVSQQELDARKTKEQIIYTGFAAQDVEKAAKSLNYDFSGVDAAKNDKDLYGLRYAEFVVPLVKSVQELSSQNDSLKKEFTSQNDSLKKEIEAQQAINADLESRLAKLEATVNGSSTGTNSQVVNVSSASLEQNVPNPFSAVTTINYTLPQQYDAAKIIIADLNGTTLKEVNVSGFGKGSVTVDTSTLSSGTYQYSLYVNGKLIDVKQMVLNK